MTGEVLTVVSAVVNPAHEDDLRAAYAETVRGRLPDGVVRSELLRGNGGEWRIATLWRDAAALDAMRAGPEAPAAPRIFRAARAEPHLAIFQVVDCVRPPVGAAEPSSRGATNFSAGG